MLRAVHLSTLDGTILPVTAKFSESILHVSFSTIDSFRLHVPWDVPSYGHQLLMTGMLARRSEPYYLSVELARGLCASVRNQATDWEVLGLNIPETFWEMIYKAGRLLLQAISLARETTFPRPEVDMIAQQSLSECLAATQILSHCYVERVLYLRKLAWQSQEKKALPTASQTEPPENEDLDEEQMVALLQQMENTPFLEDLPEEEHFSTNDTALHIADALPPKYVGTRLDWTPLEKVVKPLFFETFNQINIDLSWAKIDQNPETLSEFEKQMAWANSNGFPVTTGPVINFFPQHVPQRLQAFRGDFAAITQAVRQYTEFIVKRFRSRVNTWIATARSNTYFPLGLTALQQLELTALIIRWIREFQPTAEIITSIDQPWGEGVLNAPIGASGGNVEVLPPMTCAEILLRSHLPLSGLQLEFNIGYLHRSSYDRPAVCWSRLMDQWSSLNVPLYLTFRVPSASTPDPQATIPTHPIWKEWSSRQQAVWASQILPLLLAKPYVYGIEWAVFRDYRPHDYPHAGLISVDGKIKRTQKILAEIQKFFSLEETGVPKMV